MGSYRVLANGAGLFDRAMSAVPFKHTLIDGKYLFPGFITQERIDEARTFKVSA